MPGADGGPIPEELRAAGVRIAQPPSISRDELLGFFRQEAPDVVHLHSMSYVPHWIPVHRHLAEWNILETEHVVNIGSGHFGACDAVACVSNYARNAHRSYEDAWRDVASHFSVVYNGIDPAGFRDLPSKEEMRRKLRLPLDKPVIGRVSAIARNKLPQEALETIAQTHKKIPEAIFVIVGDGPQRAPAQEWLKQRGLSDFVRFLGERRDVPSVLRAFDVFAYYTTKDAFGNVILEAAAAGVPVVTTDVEGTREALGNAPGTLVPIGDVQTFARETAKWVTKNFQSVFQLPDRFTRQTMAHRYSTLYDNVAGITPSLPGCADTEVVTVLIPVYNARVDWLKEALESIKRQTYVYWRILIVNDGSESESVQAIRSLIEKDSLLAGKTKIVDLPRNSGVAAATNFGLEKCETSLVGLLGADDRMHPQRLARQVAKFRLCPELSVVGGVANLIDENSAPYNGENGKYVYPLAHDQIVQALAKYSAFAAPAVMYRREHVLRAGGYDASFKMAEDYDLWVRMAETNCVLANLPSTLIDYRVHSKSLSKSNPRKMAAVTRKCQQRAARLLEKRRQDSK